MTHEERWQQPPRRAEGSWQRERGYGGEYEARGPSYSRQEQREDPYEPYEREGGRRESRREREEDWQGPSPRSSYGPRFEGFRAEDVRRSSEREQWGAEERYGPPPSYQRGYGGYEGPRGGEQRGSFASRGGSYGDLGGPEHWYSDDPPWRARRQGFGEERWGSRPSFGDEPRGALQRSQERPYGQQSYGSGSGGGYDQPHRGGYEGRRDWGASAGSDWGGSERFGSGYGSEQGSQQPRMQRESQRGKGPKNYRRSDERIREEVCERLKSHADLDASDIDVQVTKGEVTLTGETASRAEKRMAEDCVEDISGVQDVTNQIHVRGREQSSMEDKTSGSSSSASLSDPSREKARPTASR